MPPTTAPCIAIDYAHLYGMGPGYGLFRYVVDLVQGLSRIKPEARFILIGMGERPPCELEAVFADRAGAWRYVQLEPAQGRGAALRDQLPFARLARREQLALYHSPYNFVPLLAPCPTVVTVHDLIWELFPDHRPSARTLAWRLHRFGARHTATRLIAVSAATAADVAQRWHLRTSKIAVVHSGTDFRHFLESPLAIPSAPALRALTADGPVIATPYNLEPHKNLATLLRAVVQLRARHPGLRVVAFGRAGCIGTREEAFNRLLGELGLTDVMVRPGLVSDADLAWLYRRAELSVFPSLYEGFGLPALEAMAVGGCVVARDGSATREVVANAGLLVETGDADVLAAAIDTLLCDPARRTALAASAVERARPFTIERMARETWEVYREVLAQAGRPAT